MMSGKRVIYRRYRTMTIEEEKEKFGFSETEEMMKGASPLLSMADPGAFLVAEDTEEMPEEFKRKFFQGEM